MKRSERLHAVVDHLRARAPRPVSAERLAGEFGVSRRTIERDLAALRAAGVPLYAVDGRSGGHCVVADYSLPPLNFRADEALAAAVALDLLTGSPFEAAARRARDRILAAAPDAVRAEVSAGVVPVDAVLRPRRVPPTPGVALLPGAIARREVVRLRYRAAVRDVEPLRLLHGDGFWYLVAWSRPGGGVRGFRTDRIEAVELTGERFVALHHDDVDADLSRWDRVPVGR
ncbi:helix-turn-helix transcriptional regulator [Xylanimonas ulmi]|uniref:helix-turn-helix transcriptional regulator n=1 Tax=Xylanimonas ulmi TaxID=228973 RepID=UPI00102C9E64|nr:WYL domain-containing protein [Xylanibacterium ulmi]